MGKKKKKKPRREQRKMNCACFRLNIGKNDVVTFYDGDDLTAKVLGQYGGSKARFKLYTSTADVTIQFQSDPATNVYGYGNGFIVHFFGKLTGLEDESCIPHLLPGDRCTAESFPAEAENSPPKSSVLALARASSAGVP